MTGRTPYRLIQIVQVAPHMRPARRLLNATVLIEPIESSVGIGLQRAAKLLQMPFGMFPFAIRRVSKQNCILGRLAALGCKLLFLEASADSIWERGIVPRMNEQFIREYAQEFGRTHEEIHQYFV
jgi:hypothetical protein